MAESYKDPVLRRYARARTRRQAFDSMLRDCYDYALPQIDPTGNRPEGAKVDAHLYDSTAPFALWKKTQRIHGQLFPPGEPFVDFDFGGFRLRDLDEDQRQQAEAVLADAAEAVSAAIDDSNFHIEINPALAEVQISTGAILFNEGTVDEPFVFEHIPISELVPEQGPKGWIDTVFWPRKVALRDIEELLPDAQLDEATRKQIDKDPDTEIDILFAQVKNPKPANPDKPFDFFVYLVDGEKRIVERSYATKPIIVFRLWRVGREVLGRGPVTLVRANILTANKTVELVLKNATIAVTGIWQADDDGVINPANIKLTPGMIIPKAVGSSGLQPLQSPGRFDVSQLVLADLRASIKEAIEGPPLPPLEGDRRTATEFWTRERELAEVEVPAHLRLFYEFDRPFAERAIDILSSDKYRGTRYHVPLYDLGTSRLRPRPASPLAKIREYAALTRTHQALLAAGAISPEITAKIVKLERYLRRFLLAHGIELDDLVNKDDLAKAQAEAAVQQQAHAAGMQQGVQVGERIGAGDLTGALQVVQQTMGAAQ
ncbi:MAG TPA: portal protein [Candidatus Omnitrophota bacterium]|nr:portal protein [Candidatus Omnitrophota bacterium]